MSYDSPPPSTNSNNLLGESSNSEQTISQTTSQNEVSDMDSMRLFNVTSNASPDRLSPNLFLNLNFDPTSGFEHNCLTSQSCNPLNALTFEWTTSSPALHNNNFLSSNSRPHLSHYTKIPTPPSSVILNTDDNSPTSPYDAYVDQFSILNLDQSILGGSSNAIAINEMEKGVSQCLNLDNLQSFALSDDTKHNELIDLEKPINININLDNLNVDKY